MATRPRAQSSPVVAKEAYPDEANAASNALIAAASVHKSSRTPISKDAGSSPYVHMNPRMFTSHPPVTPEVDEKNREDQLHASAVAMAKKIYSQQQRVIEQTKKSRASDPSAPRPHRRGSSDSDDDEVAPMQFDTLQGMAYKLAQERLAKMHENNVRNRDYQDYYGQSKVSRKFSMRPKFRRRASSEGDVEDQRRSEQIRNEMSMFSSKLSQIDQNKRQHDRDALLAAAQRNVQAQLKGMDAKITAETGMTQPTRLSEWEVKAHALAQSRSDNRMTHHGKVDLGAWIRSVRSTCPISAPPAFPPSAGLRVRVRPDPNQQIRPGQRQVESIDSGRFRLTRISRPNPSQCLGRICSPKSDSTDPNPLTRSVLILFYSFFPVFICLFF